MRRWHSELPLLKRRLELDFESHRRHEAQKEERSCECELGMFRKRRPLGCPCSRRRGRGGCKMHKTLGNGNGAKKINYLKKLIAAEQDFGTGRSGSVIANQRCTSE